MWQTGGNLFGTTFSGGANDFGAIFKVTTSGRLSLLASFDISNGSNPEAPLLLATDGFLYGTTVQGGDYGKGLIFRVSTNAGTGSNLYSFHGANGDYPEAGLAQGNDLNFYGTTTSGGANGSGIVFELSGFAPAITSPNRASTVTNPTLTVQGTLAGADGVTNVQYQLNSGAGTSATTTNHWTNWSATVTLRGGSNIFEVYSVNSMGNHSETQMVTVFYYTQSTLTLATNGLGTISHSFTSNLLVVGTNYSVTAAPSSGYLFSNWSGSITTNSNPLTFLMESNMTLTANFVPNFFIGAAGSYNGLFYDVSNGVRAESSGMIQSLTVGSNGIYSGKLYIGGTSNSVSGNFDLSGNATNQIPRASNLGPLSLGMTLNWDRKPPQITGTVQGTNGGAWTASLLAELAGSGLPSAQYTLLLPPGTNSPAGDGYALITNHAGAVTVTGALADGAAFRESVAVSESGRLAVYAAPYTNGGLLLGWLDMTNGNGAPEGELTWIRPASTSGPFTNSFTNLVPVQSQFWINPPTDTPAILITNGQLVISSASLSLTFTNVSVSNNTLVKLGGPTNTLTGSINPKTGLLTIAFGTGDGRKTIAGAGAMLQNLNMGGGYFVTQTNAGSVSLLNNRSNFPPILLRQPASQNFAAGATVSFAVGATGSEPLSYQWEWDGAVLTDGWNIAGSASSQLTVGPEMVTNGGSYSVVVANPFGSVTSSIVTLTIPPPTLKITAPKPAVTDATLTVEGTAAGKYGVANVQYRLNGGTNWISVTNTTQWTNWSATVTLQGGSNIFQAFSVDPAGNHSATRSVPVFYVTESQLTLGTNGYGTIRHSFKSNTLVVGTNYSVTASPSSGYLFSNWTGSITTNSNPLTFLMESNMTLTANFVPNFFIGAAGTYNGLFYDVTNGVGAESSGMIKSLTVGTNGIYSGKLYNGGRTNSVERQFRCVRQRQQSNRARVRFGAAVAGDEIELEHQPAASDGPG